MTQNTRPDNTLSSSNTGNQSSHHSVNTDTTTVNHNQDNHGSEHPVNTATPQYSSGENNGVTYGELSANKEQQINRNNGDTRVVNRFKQMSSGSFKYNPFVLNQVRELNNKAASVTDKEISAVLKSRDLKIMHI